MTPLPMSNPPRQAEADPDPAAWLEAHGDALYRFARARVGRREAAEDLVQETLLAALQAAGRFRGEASVRTWLLGILRRKIADAYRRRRASAATTEADLAGPGGGPSPSPFDAGGHWRRAPARWPAPESALDDAEFWRAFDECSARLPRHLARAFLLREVEGMDPDRLRAELRVAPGNLRVRLHRARLLLRECLERNWFGPDAPAPGRRP
ncbi:ECF RNA polymerase sigma factor SigE [Aquisphaera giovannonii]|uniref:RNA polymerase sigma factor n=1 Tax=Aquisphaera giovannonii TaxID=406548 RepID=A0A5B9W587_9BACT|nr:sigma-70 family RNA polymerase sigma factor [Aquisphaera giovannonii]QEH35344.1 ECF RNA polymerase sigma factor SigE [Aquisphaera giovannonii]